MGHPSVALAVLVLTAATAGTGAAAPPVTGTLSTSGYTVIAISTANGKSTTAVHRGRTFTVRSPGATMTLQLVSPKGSYAGPIVVGGTDTKVILGVRAGAVLGKVTVKRGYAVTARALAKRYTDPRRTATAKAGVPVGARSYGLVARAVGHHENARDAQGPPPPSPGGGDGLDTHSAGADPDKDGVPSAMDIDANGNGVIDQVDPNAPRPSGVRSFTNLFLGLGETVNVNADPTSAAGVDAMMRRSMELVFMNVPTGATLDCNGLIWCSPGGTGQIQPAGPGLWEAFGATSAFPACCEEGGFGRISGTSFGSERGQFHIFPRASHTQVKSGDMLVMRVPAGTGVSEIPGAIGFVFTSVPAVASWSNAMGSTTIDYPVAAGGLGTQHNPFLLSAGAMKITLRFWRPQRASIPAAGEPEGFMDIGNLRYMIQLPDAPGRLADAPFTQPQCPDSTLSTTDPSLSAVSDDVWDGVLRDLARDQPASTANTLSLTVDTGACITGKSGSLAPGGVFRLHLEGMTPTGRDHANQDLFFRIVNPT